MSSGEVAGRKAHDGVSADRASSLTCTGAGVSALLLISALWLGEPDNVVGVIHAAVARRTGPQGSLDRLDVVALSVKPQCVRESRTLMDRLQICRRKHFALVVDEHGA